MRCGHKLMGVVSSSLKKLAGNAKLDGLTMLAKTTGKTTGKNGKKKNVKDTTKPQDFWYVQKLFLAQGNEEDRIGSTRAGEVETVFRMAERGWELKN